MHHQENIIPYLARFAVLRTKIPPVRGLYSPESSMWMLNTANGPLPAIECDRASLEMLTKTCVESEADDDPTLEYLTKTDAEPERDDIPTMGFENF